MPLAWTPLDTAEAHNGGVRHFTKIAQDGTSCQSQNESHWAGSMTVDEGRSIFSWFFNSRNTPTMTPSSSTYRVALVHRSCQV